MKKQFSQRAGITMGLGLVSLLIGFMLLSACAVSPEQDRGRERAAIEQAIHAAIGWAKNKDFKQLYSVIANDSAYLEVDPENRVVKGFAEFRQAEKFWGSPNFKAIRYEIRDLKINLSNSGTVAWFYAVLDLSLIHI